MDTAKTQKAALLPHSQHLIYFFIPLPENLGIPNEFFVPIAADYTKYRPGVKFMQVDDIPYPLESSIVFRQSSHPASTEGIEAAMTAAEYYIQPSEQRKDPAKKLEMEGQTTIAEVACVVADHSETEASQAFEQAIKHVNDFISSYYVVAHHAKRLISIATLPPMVPFVNRTITPDTQPGERNGTLGMYAVNLSRTGIPKAKEEVLSLEKLQTLPIAFERIVGGLLDVFSDMRREADLALYEGNNVTAAILLESAAETLLREVLLFLHWEEGIDPADAAWVVETHDLNDVLNALDEKLGGNWSRSKAGAIKSWTINVALLRDKTVHAGYRPDNSEIHTSFESFRALISYIADRITHNWKTYPLASDAIVGAPSIAKRLGDKMNGFEMLINELHNPTSIPAHFGRWKYEVERSLKGKKSRSSHPDSCQLVLLAYPTGERLWWLVDYSKRLARRAQEPILEPGVQSTVQSFLNEIGNINSAKSLLLTDIRGKALHGGSTWYEIHKIMPLFEIDRWARSYHTYTYHTRLT